MCFKISDRLPTLILLLVIGGLLLLTKNRKKLNTKKKWAKRWLIQRRFSNLLKELETTECCDYRNYLRMDDSSFYYLLNKIHLRIEKRNTVMIDTASAEERLSATLRISQLERVTKINLLINRCPFKHLKSNAIFFL